VDTNCVITSVAVMNVAENSSILSTLSNDNLLMLTFLFRIAGLPISKYDSWYWKCYNHLILIFLYLVLIGYVISSLYRGTNDDYVSTVIITLIGTNGCFSYLTITYSVYFNGHNILDILKSMSTSEYNILSRVHDLRHISEMNSMLLRSYCWKWLFIAFFIAVASFSLFYLAYGSHADTHFLDLGNNEALRVTNIAYIYINVGWVLPFVLVRVGSHFLERRILRFIEYLESPKDLLHQPYSTDSQTTISQIILSIASFLHSSEPPEPEIPRDLTDLNISITQVLSWYDDIYALNQTLSNAFSPIIFQAIVLLFPIVVFILQVAHCLSPSFSSHLTSSFSFSILSGISHPTYDC
jgi:hypothetical protein